MAFDLNFVINRFLTAKEVMKVLSVKKIDVVYGYVKSGQLKAYRLGNKQVLRFDPKDVETFAKSFPVQPEKTTEVS